MTAQEQITQLTADLAQCRKWLKAANLKFDDSDFRVSELLKQIDALKESKCPAKYTVSRCKRNDDTLFGRIHLADTPGKTRCGKTIDDKWWILTNDGTGKANCPACLR